MNEKFPPKTPVTISSWLDSAKTKLDDAKIPSARLDAEILLANELSKNRTYLFAHSDQIIDNEILSKANEKLLRRSNREPIAYITGHKEFYGKNFLVNRHTLIPRPESEKIIDLLTEIIENNQKLSTNLKLVDVGTGSGCLGIIAKLNFPKINSTLIDISKQALLIASENAKKLGAEVSIINSNLLDGYDEKADIILANLPYVDKSWQRSPETDYEPPSALFADGNGKALIKKLIIQTNQKLSKNGHLIIEADPDQHDELISFAKENNLKFCKKSDYSVVFVK